MVRLREVVAFVAVADLDRAEQFYGELLGMALVDERPFALTGVLGDSRVRITLVETPRIAPYTVLGFTVADVASAVDELAGRGVTFIRYDGMEQDQRAIWTSPSGARVAWFLDPDGNVLSLTEHGEL